MTKNEACKLLGISRSAGKAKAEQAFSKKHRGLSYKLRPGNEKADRLQAQADIAKLMTAKDVICQLPSSPLPYPRRPYKAKTPRPKPQKAKRPAATANNYSKPQTLAEAWELYMDLMPFPIPQPVVIILLLLMLIILFAILRACFLPVAILLFLLVLLWMLFKS